MKNLFNYLILPTAISEFEAAYLRRMNRIGFGFFALHVPVFALLAHFNGTGLGLAVVLTLAALFGPALAYATFHNPRHVSMMYGFTAMLMGGLLVHFGQGPVQIEMHFYFFALIAMLALYGNPAVVLVAAATVALHHLLLWLLLPRSVFNYEAPVWVVAVHAAFVVLESVATCFIARSFFDNVIGLEKIVQARTAELDHRNQDLRLLLDNVEQGFFTIDRRGVMSDEHSAVVERWLGSPEKGMTFADYLGRSSKHAAASFQLGWDEVIADILPLEVTIAQLPQRFALGGQHFRLAYRTLLGPMGLEKVLVVISDITADVEREQLELEQREVLTVFERLTQDKSGFLEFFAEAEEQVAAVTRDGVSDLAVLKRIIHTLKGNSLLFGLASIGDQCHAMETRLTEDAARPSEEQRASLLQRWERVRAKLKMLGGEGARAGLEVDEAEYQAILTAVERGETRDRLLRRITDLKLEPTAKRLSRIGEQAQGIAARLEKGPIELELRDNNLRLDASHWAPFWSAFVHVIRNAVDHGLEAPGDRKEAGKAPGGRLEITTRLDGDEFVIGLADDGRGVDWRGVAERARVAGVAHGSEAELQEALFCDGISTATHVSEFSGRGIGMGSVRAACAALGGTVRIDTRTGEGTLVEFRFPHTAMSAAVRRAA